MINDWQAWLFLAWGLLVPGVATLILVWYSIKHRDRSKGK